MPEIHISAVICTYNRADLLGGAIQSLCDQTLDAANYEIIVVNNASTDNTLDVVSEVQSKYKAHRIVYIFEAQPGLGHARNTAYKHAVGNYVAYLDDDARAENDWLEQALRLFQTIQPAPNCVGGPVLPFYISEHPTWFKDDYIVWTWGNYPRWLSYYESFYGPNMIWQKTVLERFGGFDTDLGVKGDVLALGEETILSRRIWDAEKNAYLYYLPDMKTYHLVLTNKMTLRYQLRNQFVIGQSLSKLTLMESKKPVYQRFVLIFGGIKGLLAELMKTIISVRQHPHRENWIVENWGAIVRKIGQILGALGIYPTLRRG